MQSASISLQGQTHRKPPVWGSNGEFNPKIIPTLRSLSYHFPLLEAVSPNIFPRRSENLSWNNSPWKWGFDLSCHRLDDEISTGAIFSQCTHWESWKARRFFSPFFWWFFRLNLQGSVDKDRGRFGEMTDPKNGKTIFEGFLFLWNKVCIASVDI